ncbi:MAG: nickel-dependent lactate racemase [Clostridiaceae bacterium]|nr:nickel-dependent lactate racemase [Clostridiaceae bacterium]
MSIYSLKYGKGEVSFSLDEEVTILKGHPTAPICDIPAALCASLETPIDSPAFKDYICPTDTVALIISDMSRFWMRQDLVIPDLIRYMENICKLPAENITIIVANGTHTGGSETELRTLVTDEVFDRVKVINHDCDAPDLVFIGTTSFGTEVCVNPVAANADKVVCLGACTHHVMAGYGGGRKSILPGISGRSTIRQNHLHSLDLAVPRSNPLIGNGITWGNPLNEDMCQAAALMKSLYMVNLVMNADMKLAAIYSGNWLTSWQAGCMAVNDIYSVPINRRADAIIVSCGGYPKDMSLYQGTKTIDNVESGLKPGGTLIIAIEAIDGGGPAEYFHWIDPLKEGRLYEALKADFTIPGYVFFLNCEQASRYRIMLCTSISPEIITPMGIEAYPDMDTLLKNADLSGKDIFLIPNGATVIPTLTGGHDAE